MLLRVIGALGAALAAALALGGCQVPRVYDVTYFDARLVSVELAEPGLSLPRELGELGDANQVSIEAESVALGPFGRAPGYTTRVVRLPNGALELRFEYAGGQGEVHTIIDWDGRLGVEFPTAAGDAFDFPGFHQAGITAFARTGTAGPLAIEGEQHAFLLEYRPSYDVQRELSRSPRVQIALRSPLDNVASVTRMEHPPRTTAALLLGVSLACLAGGVALVWPRSGQPDAARNLGLGFGIPIIASATATGAYGAWLLSLENRSVPIEPRASGGMP